MNKKLSLAVASAVMAFGASAANAGITIPAGDWTIDIGGNVNAYYTNTRFKGDLRSPSGTNVPGSRNANTINTGLLPAAIGIGGKTRQNDLDIAFQFTFFTGVESGPGGSPTLGGGTTGQFNNNSFGSGSMNIRQAFLTFGDASWGTIKMGRDLGLFGSDAILNDMTLLGTGTGAGGNGNTTLGRIGSGYIYADWVGQIQYMSPNWDGFSFGVAARQPWGNSANSELGWDAKASYEWAGDVAGKVWVGFLSQRTRSEAFGAGITAVPALNERVRAWELGGKVNVSDFGLVGYYYDGKGIGDPGTVAGGAGGGLLGLSPTTFLSGGLFTTSDLDNEGGYVQGTYTIPGAGTKLGLSWGTSRIGGNSGTAEFENRSWIVGAYHPLTKSLNLVAEYIDADYKNIALQRGQNGEARTIALGAILFF